MQQAEDARLRFMQVHAGRPATRQRPLLVKAEGEAAEHGSAVRSQAGTAPRRTRRRARVGLWTAGAGAASGAA